VSDHLLSLGEIAAAREAIAGRVHRTPTLSSSAAAAEIRAAGGADIADGQLHLKAEHFQKTCSFKPRGALHKLDSLSAAERAPGVITMSAGNAAQGFAWAGRELGVRVVAVMPLGAVPSKVDACRGYGAEVVLFGEHVGETFDEMQRLREERGLTFCHSFDDPALIAGYGSIGLEILEDLPDADVVVVPVGGGGLISGVATAIKESKPSVRIFGVEPEGSNALSVALERGEIVRIIPVSVADGLGAPFAGEWTLAAARRYLEGIVLLDDSTILGGLRFAALRLKQVLEPAGAAALAAVLYGKVPLREGERVCVVLSGGNLDLGRLGAFLEAAAPLPSASPIPA
jgi:threonine dehydratase